MLLFCPARLFFKTVISIRKEGQKIFVAGPCLKLYKLVFASLFGFFGGALKGWAEEGKYYIF